ncbi:MAG: ATP-binding protein [Bacteroidia bacterium]
MIPARNETLKINSKPEHLRLVERLIEDVCQLFNVQEDAYGNILIAVTEAVNNAIYHGNKNNPDKFVNIGFQNSEKQLIFSITDEGQGFDHVGLPDPTDPKNIDKPSGRGVFLMKNLADSIQFEQNGKTVRLAFNN